MFPKMFTDSSKGKRKKLFSSIYVLIALTKRLFFCVSSKVNLTTFKLILAAFNNLRHHICQVIAINTNLKLLYQMCQSFTAFYDLGSLIWIQKTNCRIKRNHNLSSSTCSLFVRNTFRLRNFPNCCSLFAVSKTHEKIKVKFFLPVKSKNRERGFRKLRTDNWIEP